MDTFFDTSKAGKYSRCHTLYQIFVVGKLFLYVVPIKAKIEVLQAVKQLMKSFGALDDIISDTAREQKYQDMSKLLNEIGTTLRIIENVTPWANKAELYIGLIKQAVQKYLKESDCPLDLQDYCVERRACIDNLTNHSMLQIHGSN